MVAQERLINAKISILQLSQELGNISKACKRAGVARSSFYEIKKAYEQFGRAGLAPRPRRKPRMPNAIPEALEAKVLDMTRRFPSYSYQRISTQLQLENMPVSGPGVRRIWERHGLTKCLGRYLWLEQEVSGGRGIMTEGGLRALAKLKRLQEPTDQHVEAHSPGELVSQDLYFVGCIKGVGKIYMQAAVDCATSMGFAKLCLTKLPIGSVALLHERAVPFYDENGISVRAVLTDCGREYCGRADQHLFELYTASMGIEHRTTRPASPYTNGFAERFHQTLKNEFFGKVFREKVYTNVDELQHDLDVFMEFYNRQRAHSGYQCNGRTPYQTFQDMLQREEGKAQETDVIRQQKVTVQAV